MDDNHNTLQNTTRNDFFAQNGPPPDLVIVQILLRQLAGFLLILRSNHGKDSIRKEI